MRVGKVKIKLRTAAVECPFCHHIFNIEQKDEQYREPVECEQESGGCGRKAKRFILLEDKSVYTKVQTITLEEINENGLPITLDVKVQDDLIDTVIHRDIVVVIGVLKSVQRTQQFAKTTFFDWYLVANSIEKKPIKKIFSDDIDKAASELGKDLSLLYRIKRALENISAKEAIIGEDKNKLLLPLLCAGSLAGQPQIILIMSNSSAGKTNLAKMMERIFKVKKVGRFSATALDYADLSDYDIIYLQEAGEADLHKREFRLLSADDEGYNIEITVKDEQSGRFKTEEIHIPPKTLLTSTTTIDIPEEFATRVWILSIDESEDQTNKILEFKTHKSKRLIEEAKGETVFGKDIEEIKSLFMRLKPYKDKILIPYEGVLPALFTTKKLRVRRDIDKALSFIELSAFLFQENRVKIDLNGSEFLIAAPQDLYHLVKIADESLQQTTSGYDKRINNALNIIRTKFADSEITKNDLAAELETSTDYAYKLLESLTTLGFLRKIESGGGKGKLNIYRTSEKINSKLRFSFIPSINWSEVINKEREFLNPYSESLPEEKEAYLGNPINPFTGKVDTYPILSQGVKSEYGTGNGKESDKKTGQIKVGTGNNTGIEMGNFKNILGEKAKCPFCGFIRILNHHIGNEICCEECWHEEQSKEEEDCCGDDYDCEAPKFRSSPNLDEDTCSQCVEIKPCEWQILEGDERRPICEECKRNLEGSESDENSRGAVT